MWILHLHILILNVDSCLLDALVTCVTAAFLDLRLPKVRVDLDADITVNINEALISEELEHIPLADMPVLTTFIILDAHIQDKAKILCDPVAELFDLLPSKASIVVGNNARVYRTVISGYCGDEGIIRQLFQLAASRQKLVSEALLKARDANLKMNSA
ncbi:hypothetical protein Tcan_12184 [Toxocara canis]|uniref:Uncharacterized protein n=1 Tax=Toxocara canis TaxID=6265 RepID=A0A0B2USV8_TOXCA|nr:hypothetical protein Tcan_12184 [Toxocara canis]